MFQTATKIIIGKGYKAKFWTSNWVDGKSVAQCIAILYSFVRSNISVAEAVSNKQWVRDINNGLSTQALVEYLQLWDSMAMILLDMVVQYTIEWKLSSNGHYSALSAYNLFVVGKTRFACGNII